MTSETQTYVLVAAGLFLAALIPLMVTPVLPLIDFYNHVARFFVLAHVGASPLLQKYYQADWSLLPDIGLDAIATPLLAILPPLLAGHIIAILIMAVLYGGVLYFHRALTGQNSLLVAALMLPLLYSYILNWGFAPFLLGLGFAFWAAGWWLFYRHRPRLAVPVACVFAVLIYVSHGLAFSLYCILVTSLEVGLFLAQPTRRPAELGRALSLLAIQAVIPALLFVFWYRNMAFHGSMLAHLGFSPKAYVNGLTARPGHTGLRRLSTILRVEEGPAYWFDIATLTLQAIAVCFLIWRRHIVVVRPAWVLIAVAILLIGLTPSKMFNGDYIADRLPLFAALCVLSALSVGVGAWRGKGAVISAFLITIVFARLGAIALDWHGYGQDYREFRSLAARIPRGSLAMGIAVGAGRHETGVPRCEIYGPLLIAQYDQIGPLFDFRGQHPLLLVGRLRKAADILESNPATAEEKVSDYNAYLTGATAAGFDYFLVCNRRLLTQPFPEGLTLVAKTPQFALLRVNR